MVYRVDVAMPRPDAAEHLIDLGALDVEAAADGTLAALLPDDVDPALAAALAGALAVSPAVGRDDGSVWILRPRAITVGGLRLAPADHDAAPDTLRLQDTGAFGTGLHPTTALCLEALRDLVGPGSPGTMLDVGTGSGILALAALHMGVPQATGLDIDPDALRVAGENARLNGLADRLALVHGGPDALDRRWPLVLANVVAAPLIEMAPTLAARLAHRGVLLLSGIAVGLEPEVGRAYRHVGLQVQPAVIRDGWALVRCQASW